jgi:hypothetical protein
MKIYKVHPDRQDKYPISTVKYAFLGINNGLNQWDFEEIMETNPKTDLRQQLETAKYCFSHIVGSGKKEFPDLILESDFLILNSRALSVLKDCFGSVIEFFQLKPELRHFPHKKMKGLIEFQHKSEDWYIAYQKQAFKALDYSESIFPRIYNGIAWIYGHFDQTKIMDNQIFRLLWEPTLASPTEYEEYFYRYTRFFVTDKFIETLKNSDLKYDLKFVLYWDSENRMATDHLADQRLEQNLLAQYLEDKQKNTKGNSVLPSFPIDELYTTLQESINLIPNMTLETQPQDIIAAIVQFIDQHNPTLEQTNLLGVLFGQQIVREHNWHWKLQDSQWFLEKNGEVLLPSELIAEVLSGDKEVFYIGAFFNTLGLSD